MRTDWALVRRLGAELETALRGARLQDAGVVGDGRPALVFWSRGAMRLLCIDLFSSPPALTLESGELSTTRDEPGFTRALARTLHGMVLAAIEAREHDRLLRLRFRTRSRFGVGDEVDLYIELVPRFGNALLVKAGMVISARKEFPGAHGSREVRAGMPYVLPPLPQKVLPRAVEEGGAEPRAALAYLEADAALREPLYVYRRHGRLIQAHLVELPALHGELSREPSLLDLFAEERDARLRADAQAQSGSRRAALLRSIAHRARSLDEAQAALASQRAAAAQREGLRREGEAIYATLHELAPDARAQAKAQAAKLFAQYRKLGAALPHIEKRERALAMQKEALETLLWETQRVGDDDLPDIESTLALLDPRSRKKRAPPPRRPTRRRKPLEMRTALGSRILVGRSPVENAELTFRVARPNDLWFHARGVPGAHVILARDDRSEPPAEDLELAAALAAAHSKARESVAVTVDYTQRKHVRKQPNAPPGLVFYTEATSIVVAPRAC
ncbi:MAG: NFACT RNA binding domain-containing protein [Candidatus Tyrphobacter sp.]